MGWRAGKELALEVVVNSWKGGNSAHFTDKGVKENTAHGAWPFLFEDLLISGFLFVCF